MNSMTSGTAMNDVQIGQPWQLHWGWAILACVALAVYAVIQRRAVLKRFATPFPLARKLVGSRNPNDLIATLLVMTAMVLLVFALVDVRWGKVWREVPQKGIEVIFVLDVSRSMLADDASPSRLQRAKQQISDMVEEMRGDRVGLVLFSGEVRQKIPLTNHYEDFRQRLRNVGPEDIARGGSRLGDAIRVASSSFLSKTPDHKAIVIFTDGEDMESEPVAAARAANSEHGIRIFCVGLGNSKEGAPVPARTRGSFVRHEGVEVRSKLNGDILRKIADAAGGDYIPAETKQVDMSQVYHGYVARVEQGEFASARINSYEARFQWFLGGAIAFLVAEILWSSRSDQRDRIELTGRANNQDGPPKPIETSLRTYPGTTTPPLIRQADRALSEQNA